MANFIMGVIVAVAVMNPAAAKQFLSKSVDGLHAAYVQAMQLSK